MTGGVMFGVEPSRRVGRVRRIRRGVTLGLFGGLLVFSVACGGGDSKDVDEIIDVKKPIVVDTSEDLQEAPRTPQLVGVLPGDFPEDLPLFLPASLVDFGGQEGRPSVTLLTSEASSQVKRSYEEILRNAGWAVERGGHGFRMRKGGRSARVVFEGQNPGTTYRVEY